MKVFPQGRIGRVRCGAMRCVHFAPRRQRYKLYVSFPVLVRMAHRTRTGNSVLMQQNDQQQPLFRKQSISITTEDCLSCSNNSSLFVQVVVGYVMMRGEDGRCKAVVNHACRTASVFERSEGTHFRKILASEACRRNYYSTFSKDERGTLLCDSM